MAKSSARVVGLGTLARRLDRRAKQIPVEVQHGIDDTAKSALKDLAVSINSAIAVPSD